MKVKELIEELEILNPEKSIYGSVEQIHAVSHIVFAIDRVDISTGKILIVSKPG